MSEQAAQALSRKLEAIAPKVMALLQEATGGEPVSMVLVCGVPLEIPGHPNGTALQYIANIPREQGAKVLMELLKTWAGMDTDDIPYHHRN